MFNDDDFEKMNDMEDQVPDGVLDASDYQRLNEEIAKIYHDTDFLNVESKMKATMSVINLLGSDEDGEDMDADVVFGVVLGLAFHLTNIFTSLAASDPEGLSEYFDYLMNELLPSMKEESEVLPYWDM